MMIISDCIDKLQDWVTQSVANKSVTKAWYNNNVKHGSYLKTKAYRCDIDERMLDVNRTRIISLVSTSVLCCQALVNKNSQGLYYPRHLFFLVFDMDRR